MVRTRGKSLKFDPDRQKRLSSNTYILIAVKRNRKEKGVKNFYLKHCSLYSLALVDIKFIAASMIFVELRSSLPSIYCKYLPIDLSYVHDNYVPTRDSEVCG